MRRGNESPIRGTGPAAEQCQKEEFLPYCKVAHVTKIDHAYQADTFFPNLDETGEWEITADSDEQTYFDLEYAFLKYERKGEAKPRIRK